MNAECAEPVSNSRKGLCRPQQIKLGPFSSASLRMWRKHLHILHKCYSSMPLGTTRIKGRGGFKYSKCYGLMKYERLFGVDISHHTSADVNCVFYAMLVCTYPAAWFKRLNKPCSHPDSSKNQCVELITTVGGGGGDFIYPDPSRTICRILQLYISLCVQVPCPIS